jgi:hypothetical protein
MSPAKRALKPSYAKMIALCSGTILASVAIALTSAVTSASAQPAAPATSPSVNANAAPTSRSADGKPLASARTAPSTPASAAPSATAAPAMSATANPRGNGSADPHGGGDPHAGHGHGDEDQDETPRLLQDTAEPSPSVAGGSVVAMLLDESDKVIPNALIELKVIESNIAKGDSQSKKTTTTSADGIGQFQGLQTGSGFSYRVVVNRQGAQFGSPPFQLPPFVGVRVRLHVYPVERDLERVTVVMQTGFYAEVKDDRIQLEQAIGIFNMGKTAWSPLDLEVKLPEGFTAFTAEKAAGDIAVDSTKQGYKIRGTFAPGRHDVSFRFQVPYSGDNSADMTVGLPPRLAVVRVIAAAAQGMAMDVPGFPQPKLESDNEGQRALITEKQGRRDQEIRSFDLHLRNIPETGLPRNTVRLLCLGVLLLMVGSIITAIRASRNLPQVKLPQGKTRDDLIDDLRQLEAAHKSGDVGIKTYERARRELLDALALTFADKPI